MTAPPRPPKRKMPKKTAVLDLGVDGYEGFSCEAWINAPISFSRYYIDLVARVTADDSKPEDSDELVDVFLAVFPSWEGFVDWRGDKIPHTRAGVESLPLDLTETMWQRRAEALRNGALPAPLGSGSSNGPSDSEKG